MMSSQSRPLVMLALSAITSAVIAAMLVACGAFAIGAVNDSPEGDDGGDGAATDGGQFRDVVFGDPFKKDGSIVINTDANGSTPCGSTYPFCDDFERGDVEAANDWALNQDTGFVGIEGDTSAPSQTRSLVFHTTANDDVTSWVARSLNQDTRRVRASFAMRIDNAITQISQLVSVALIEHKYVFLQTTGQVLQLVEQDQTKGEILNAAPTTIPVPNGWARYDFDVDFKARKATVRSGATTITLTLTIDFSKAVDLFRIGFTYSQGGEQGSIRFDDLGVRED